MRLSRVIKVRRKVKHILINTITVSVLAFSASSYTAGQKEIENSFVSPRLATLKKQLDAGHPSALEDFWREITKQGTPLVEPIKGDNKNVLVTFLWRGTPETKNVLIFSQLNKMDMSMNIMAPLSGSDVWYKTYRLRNDARFTYLLSPNDSLIPLDRVEPKDMEKRVATFQKDPLNPKISKRNDEFSVVELGGAPPQPWVIRRPGIPSGSLDKHRFKSHILNNERDVWVYTPPHYLQGIKHFPVLLMLERDAFTADIPLPTILDNLQARGEISGPIAVFVEELDIKELSCDSTYAEFLSKELLPWLRTHYRVTTDPRKTIVGGVSISGLAAAYVAMRHPELFGNVLSLSGSFWWTPQGDHEPEWLTRQFVIRPRLQLHFYLEVGLLENTPLGDSDGVTMLAVSRHLRDVLQAKGYTVDYKEFNGGHEEINWQGGIAHGLKTLLNQYRIRKGTIPTGSN